MEYRKYGDVTTIANISIMVTYEYDEHNDNCMLKQMETFNKQMKEVIAVYSLKHTHKLIIH